MATYRGSDGFLALGGAQKGATYLKGAVLQNASTATIDGNGAALAGVILPGDTFTVAGDATVYTVASGGAIGEAVANERVITFTPAVARVGGWPDNAAVSFPSNSIAEVRSWEATATRAFLDDTVMGDPSRTGRLDLQQWSGRAEAFFDKQDPKQGALVDAILSGTASAQFALVLGLLPGKQLWGSVLAQSFAATSERGALVGVQFTFEGTGALAPNWSLP